MSNLDPKERPRSSSFTVPTNPASVRRPVNNGGIQKPLNYNSQNNQDSTVKSGEHLPQVQESNTTTVSCLPTPQTSAGGVSPWSGSVHHQRTQSLPLAQPTPNVQGENNNPSYLSRGSKRVNNIANSSRFSDMEHRNRTQSFTSGSGHRPRTISDHGPVSIRPQSFLGSRDVNGSPTGGSPASPASAACSTTDSTGSSVSIDDPDGWTEFQETAMRYGNSMTPEEPIAEENYDENLGSNGYMTMSPGAGSPMIEGYVPMAPLSSVDGYIDMSPRGYHTDLSPAASSCSITSGTPSTDIKFSEYRLEKVSSYFTPSEEDDTNSDVRPHRAFSLGSRLETVKGKSCHDVLSSLDARVRAFSVGSGERSKVPVRVLRPPTVPYTPHSHSKIKSSSSPLLSSSFAHGSHSSVEPMDDLMEIDYSQGTGVVSGYVDMRPKNQSTTSGYVEMKPGVCDTSPSSTPEFPYMDMRPSTSPLRSFYHDHRDIRNDKRVRDTSSYMDMNHSTSPQKSHQFPAKHNNSHTEMPGRFGTSPKNPVISPKEEDYMNMDYQSHKNIRLGKPIGSARTQPIDLPQPKKTPEGYIEMDWVRHQRKSSLDSIKVNPTLNNNNMDDYINMSAKKKEKRASRKDKTRSQPITIQSTTNSKASSSSSPVFSLSSLMQSGRKLSTGTPPKVPSLPLSSSNYSPSSSPFSSLRRPRLKKNSRKDSKDSSSTSIVTPTGSTGSSTIFPLSLNSPSSPMKPFQKSPEFDAPRKCAVDASNGTVRLSPPSDCPRINSNRSEASGYAEMGFDREKTTPNKNEDDMGYVSYSPGTVLPSNNFRSENHGDYAVMDASVPTSKPVRKTSVPLATGQVVLAKQLSDLSVHLDKSCGFKPITDPRNDRLGAGSPTPGDIAPLEDTTEGICDASCSDNAFHSSESLRADVSDTLDDDRLNQQKCCKGKLSRSNSRPGSVSSDKTISRPGSVTLEITRALLSRPSSVSSELGSTSTLVGSRPASVSSDQVSNRPASVSSERELHYASLDLPACADEDGSRSPRCLKTQISVTESCTSSPLNLNDPPISTYAEIDFIRSEGMKQSGKVKH